jgi:heme/copper-type cytochrome/quinol oxidase subunit 4
MSILRERVTFVWLALMVLTCVTTWGLSKDIFSPAVAVVGIFLIAAVKVRYVMLDFMELREAPIPVRIAFEAWPVMVAVMILALWFLTPPISILA